jgi:hypothetical protein
MHRIRKEIEHLFVARQTTWAREKKPQCLIDFMTLDKPTLARRGRLRCVVVSTVLSAEEI